jgi:hypothetical protein
MPRANATTKARATSPFPRPHCRKAESIETATSTIWGDLVGWASASPKSARPSADLLSRLSKQPVKPERVPEAKNVSWCIAVEAEAQVKVNLLIVGDAIAAS